MPTSSIEQMLADEVNELQHLLAGWSTMPARSVGRIACGLGRVVSLWVQQCKQGARHARRRTKADPRKLFTDFRTQREDVLNLLDAMGRSNGGDILRELQGLETSRSHWMPAHASIRTANPGQIARALTSIAAWLPTPTKAASSDAPEWISGAQAILQRLVSDQYELTRLAKRYPSIRRSATDSDRRRIGNSRLLYVYDLAQLERYTRESD